MSMSLSSSGRLALRLGVPAAIVLALIYLTFAQSGEISLRTLTSTNHASDAWHFVYARDWNNYGLAEDQCEQAFPRYGQEINRAVQFRSSQHVTIDEMNTEWRDDGIMRLMMYDNQVCTTSGG